MRAHLHTIVHLLVASACARAAELEWPKVYLDDRPVYGAWREDARGGAYVSFLGVPYADQPLGDLRFKELQPVRDKAVIYALDEGPSCPQQDVFYGKLARRLNETSEACIYANIHVPKDVLPKEALRKESLLKQNEKCNEEEKCPGAPILVFIHGGGFAFGSGDTDLHGPERLVGEGVIVITFNYRLNVFGFLSLNSKSIPGNNGLRDMVTLLRWVRQHARALGGNPDDVTLAGQSAGAVATHLLTLSPAAKGLFKRAILMSGTAMPSFVTTSPLYAQFVASQFLASLDLNSTEPESIHDQLVQMPLEKLMSAHSALLEQFGLSVFLPVVESSSDNAIIIDDPETLLVKGEGNHIPLLVGYTDEECESFRPRFEALDILARLQTNPLLILSPSISFSAPQEVSLRKSQEIMNAYFGKEPTMDKYIRACTDNFFRYQALRVAKYRAATEGPMYLYQFSYSSNSSAIKQAMDIDYEGAAHVEDLTYIFQTNSLKLKFSSEENAMWKWIVNVFGNFIRESTPIKKEESGSTEWPSVNGPEVVVERIESPSDHHSSPLTTEEQQVLNFFSSIYQTPKFASSGR